MKLNVSPNMTLEELIGFNEAFAGQGSDIAKATLKLLRELQERRTNDHKEIPCRTCQTSFHPGRGGCSCQKLEEYEADGERK